MKGETPHLCIIHPDKGAYSETFIRAQIEKLPAKITVLYGGFFPSHRKGDRRLLSLPVWLLARGLSALEQATNSHPKKRTETLASLIQNRALAGFFRNNQIDGVLAEYGPTGVSVLESCQKANLPLIVHFHGFDVYHRSVLEQYERFYQRLFNQAAALIAVSRAMERRLVVLGAQHEKVHYNPCGVDCSLFHGAGPDKNPSTFIAVGRFVDKKAPHLTLLAFKKVAEKIPQSRLVMVGEGQLLEACQQLSRALNIAGQVEFTGILSHGQVASLMRGARALVQHSLTTGYGDSEGTPVAILEAGASGLPVVSTRHAGIQDVVLHGETGFLVTEGDVDAMGTYMIDLASDPKLAAAMGLNARKYVVNRFSMETSINRLYQIIHEAIRQHQSGGSPVC